MGAKFFYRNIDLVYFVNNKLINNDLINQKDRILLSFSGGQDSICFVFILNQLYSQLELDITFFWCHHLWQTDSFYLMQQIAKLSFLLQFNNCFPIPLNSISSELLARKWRQKCSYRVSLFYNYSKICLAHTFNDKVENIFLNFIRGTGLIGLTPLRWTQFISKSNITNKKHISRHNYLNNSCFGYSVRRKATLYPYRVQQKAFIPCKGIKAGLSAVPYKGKAQCERYGVCEVKHPNLTNPRFVVQSKVASNSMGSSKKAVIKAVSEAVIKRNCQLGVRRKPLYPSWGIRNNSCASRTNRKFVQDFLQRGVPPTIARGYSLTGTKVVSQDFHTLQRLSTVPLRGKAQCERRYNTLQEFSAVPYKGKAQLRSSLQSLTLQKASLKSNGPNLCILQSNSDKLKILTKKVIQKDFALPQSQRDVLHKSGKSYKSKICTICTIWSSRQVKKELSTNEQLFFQRGTQRITNLTKINSKFVQIGKPLPQKGMFSLATKARPEIITCVTNEYKAKPCQVFMFQPTSYSSIINSCHTKYFIEQRRPMLGNFTSYYKWFTLQLPFTLTGLSTVPPRGKAPLKGNEAGLSTVPPRGTVKSPWKVWSIRSKTDPKHSKQLLNSEKGCYLVRPLLSISRIELNKICYFWKLPIYPDKSNQKVKFFRNRVRGQLLPTIKLFFNLNIENIFLQLAKIIETEDYCLTQIVNEFTKNTDVYHTKLDIYSKKK